jgi:TRAP-type C4-dicarboxylate transport system permease small subunit
MKVADGVSKVVKVMEGVAVLALWCIMVLTASDVVLGMFRRPIAGAYDLVGIGSGIAVSFSLAVTSWKKQHIMIDTIYKRFPATVQALWAVVLRSVNGIVFAVLIVYLFGLSFDLIRTGDVCGTVPWLPLWPIPLILGCACLGQCLVMLSDLVGLLRGGRT